jgi:spermidine/putrescine transport system ATP-binding protein
MNSGQLQQVATPGDLYERPANRFVADFIGTINLFSGTVQIDASDRRRIISPALATPIAASAGATLPLGSNVWAGVRPEKIRIMPADTAAPDSNTAVGTIVTSAYLGAVTLCDVRTADGTMIKVCAPNTTPGTAADLAIGRQVHLAWDADAVVVLTD